MFQRLYQSLVQGQWFHQFFLHQHEQEGVTVIDFDTISYFY